MGVEGFKGSNGEGERKQEANFFELYQVTVKILTVYGIDDLTPIEATHLKKILRECIEQRRQELGALSRNEIAVESAIGNPVTETIYRWFNRLYGIDVDFIGSFQGYEVTDETDGKRYHFSPTIGDNFKEKRRELEEEAQHKMDSLREDGHESFLKAYYPEKFKKLIKKYRDKAHEI